jgi:hypothetical protein
MIMTEKAKAPPSVFRDERSDGATEIYIRGPGWPSTVNVSDAPANPWSKQNWNLTRQVQILKHDQSEANRLARAAGAQRRSQRAFRERQMNAEK